ncbi:MAG: PQQ-binding-like beta-propeller repeat protein [Bryobacteraceae bacterium]|nr:PQQ-binding-like beta-propeller repeat protein [Bryobacteraceae bacterium]
MRATCLVLVLCSNLAFASDWPRYRGVNGDGVSSDKDVPSDIGPGKSVLWKIATPKGNSSPVIGDGRIYLTGWEGDSRFVLCYDAKSGKELWRRSVPRSFTEAPHPINGFTTPTVSLGAGRVLAFIPEFGLTALRAEDGKELWTTKLGPFGAVQGLAGSPIFHDGRVYLLIDTPEQAWLGAYDANTGKLDWKVERQIGLLGGYSTPALYTTAQGRTLVIAPGAQELTAYDAKTGERVWWARGVVMHPAAPPLVTKNAVYTVEPYGEGGGGPPWKEPTGKFDKNKDGVIELSEVAGDAPEAYIWRRILASIDRNTGNKDNRVTEEEFVKGFMPPQTAGGLVRVKLEGKGDVSSGAVEWRHTKGVPYVTAPLLFRDVLWLVRNGGIVSTLDPATGKVLKESRLKDAIGEYYAQPVAAEDRIYFVSKDGKVTVTTAKAEWEILSSGDLAEDVIATPAIADSKVYIRTDKSLWCFGKAAA